VALPQTAITDDLGCLSNSLASLPASAKEPAGVAASCQHPARLESRTFSCQLVKSPTGTCGTERRWDQELWCSKAKRDLGVRSAPCKHVF